MVLEPGYPEDEFEKYVINVLKTVAPGDAFILGIADNAMPTTVIERVERISELVEQYGNYPIKPETLPA